MLSEHLFTLFKCFIIHGHCSVVLLLATLLPLVKDKLGDHCSSKNYRSIAISSLFLKIFDWVVLLLFGHCLQLDDLQFEYQEDISGTMCSWLALETINHFIANGSEVFTCIMDMTKAFDKVVHSVLFRKLMKQLFHQSSFVFCSPSTDCSQLMSNGMVSNPEGSLFPMESSKGLCCQPFSTAFTQMVSLSYSEVEEMDAGCSTNMLGL